MEIFPPFALEGLQGQKSQFLRGLGEGRRFVPAVVFWGKERDKQVRIVLL